MNTNPHFYNPRLKGDFGLGYSPSREPDLGRPNRWDVWDILVQGYHAPLGEEVNLAPEPHKEDLSALQTERPSARPRKERLAEKKALRDAIRATRFTLVDPSEQPVTTAEPVPEQRRGRGRPKGSKDTKPRKPRAPEMKPRSRRVLPYLEQHVLPPEGQRHGAQGEPATAR